jgi:hypothetical protein
VSGHDGSPAPVGGGEIRGWLRDPDGVLQDDHVKLIHICDIIIVCRCILLSCKCTDAARLTDEGSLRKSKKKVAAGSAVGSRAKAASPGI